MFEAVYFQRRTMNTQKLINFGFIAKQDTFEYETNILNGQFKIKVIAAKNGDVSTQVYDSETGDEYTLYKTDNVVGSFVGKVRTAVESVLTDISEKCFDLNIFKTEQAHRIIEYVRETYGDELEFLWPKFPDNAIWRRKDNKKWYGLVLTVARKKLGLKSEEIVEIIDLRIMPDKVESTVDGKKYFPGWHMNKKSWYTIILDNSVDTGELCRRIDESYRLAVK